MENKQQFTGQEIKASAEGFTKEPMSLDEAAIKLQAEITKPSICKKCGEQVSDGIIAFVTADNLHEELVMKISFKAIMEKLQGIPKKVQVNDKGTILTIRLSKPEA